MIMTRTDSATADLADHTAWPVAPLAAVPGPTGAQELAVAVRSWTGQEPADGPIDLESICQLAGVEVSVDMLGAGDGGYEGLLIPLDGNRFAVAADPTPAGGWGWLTGKRRQALARQRTRFRIGHELGHALCYWRDGAVPRRHLPGSAEQEAFCDAFSRALLVPRRRAEEAPPTVDGLLRLQRRCDVSLEVAARAMSAAQSDLRIELWHGECDRLELQWSTEPRSGSATAGELLDEFHGDRACWLPARRQLVRVLTSR
jgi:hypothetical protein